MPCVEEISRRFEALAMTETHFTKHSEKHVLTMNSLVYLAYVVDILIWIGRASKRKAVPMSAGVPI